MSLLSLPQILAAVNKIRERSAANTSQVSLRQQRSLRDPGVRGPVWVSRVAFPAPETGEGDITSLLSDAIQILGCGHEKYTAPSVLEVKAEWTGYRPGALPHESEPNISEKEKYQCLMGDIEDSCTVLYLHGGSFMCSTPLCCIQSSSLTGCFYL